MSSTPLACSRLTLGAAALHALLTNYPDERDLPGEEKWRRGKLADKVSVGGNVDLSLDEMSKIKTLIGKMYGPTVIMRAWPLLDPTLKDK